MQCALAHLVVTVLGSSDTVFDGSRRRPDPGSWAGSQPSSAAAGMTRRNTLFGLGGNTSFSPAAAAMSSAPEPRARVYEQGVEIADLLQRPSPA
jgi:hypothetical protein